MESQANEDNDLFISNNYSEAYALDSMRGKPPYNRSKMNRQREQNQYRRQNQQSVEMSALEIDQNGTVMAPSQITSKSFRSGHPDRAKRHSNRY